MPKKASADVLITPTEVPPLPGNTVTFTAPEAEGAATATITTNISSWTGAASNAGAASVSVQIDNRHEFITVDFYDDGKQYASGTLELSKDEEEDDDEA